MTAALLAMGLVVAGGNAAPFSLALSAPSLGQSPDRPAASLVDPLRPPGSLRMFEGGGAGRVRGGRGVRAGLACVASAMMPGLGHAVAGQYVPRGLAFTGAFVASAVGSAVFIVIGEQQAVPPAFRFPAEAAIGAATLFILATILYVWSVVDSIILASSPVPVDLSKAVILGRN